MMKRLTMIAVALALLMPLVAGGQTSVTKSVSWAPSPPADATHSAAIGYIVQWRAVGAPSWSSVGVGPVVSTATTIDIPIATAVECRVAAIDAEGHQSPWSPVSDPYTYRAPGACGKPSWL